VDFTHSFVVPVAVERAWDVLLDLPRVAPCMPGAALTDAHDDLFTGTVKVKLGPISLTYRGRGRFVERNAAARRVVIEATGRDIRSSGTASATVTATLHPDGENSTGVMVQTALTVTGRPAQFGRSVLADVGAKLIGQFADCLASELRSERVSELAAVGGGSPDARGGAGARAGQARPTRTVPGAVAARDEEAIDLLEVTGAGAKLRRYGPYAAGFVAGVVVARALARRR
jgi:carbon monoxide dehydrogenase subunit G